ncbi:MAG: insulinase family protein [Dehalococcoidales bacterium]|nr:insulinase family protein [Dehalococcoidales bacterium]
MYQKTTLKNGIRVITSGMPYARSVTLSIFIGTGSRYEKKREMGISHFLEHILFKGTKKRPSSRVLSETIEGVGGILNGETDKELTVYWCKVAKPHFPLALDVLTDMILNSKFDPAEIIKERQVIIEEINRSKDSPSQLVDELTDSILFPGHQLGRDVAGTKKTVSTMTREDMLDYVSRQYSPANTVFSIAGDVNHDEMVSAISTATEGWQNYGMAAKYKPYIERPNPRLCIQPKKTEQVHLCLALPGISLFDPRRYPLALLNVILGAGMSSRLFLEVRDRLGLAYSVHSYIDHYKDSGAIVIYAGVDPQKVSTAISAILEQLVRFKNELVSESELLKAKELSKGRLWLRMEDSYAVSGWLGGQEILTGKVITDDQMINIIDSITAQQVQDVARELLTEDKLRMAVVGHVAKDDSLQKLLKI